MICKYCGLDKPNKEFQKCAVIKGITYYRKKCSFCKEKRQKARRQEIRNNFYEYKKTLSCSICGMSDYRVLEFHHLNPKEKEENVSNLIGQGRSTKVIMAEMTKCNILCANCHRILHFEE